MEIKWSAETYNESYIGSGTITVPDEADIEEINDIVRKEICQYINWHWNGTDK